MELRQKAINDDCPGGCGSVFEISPAGKLTTIYRFCTQGGCTDGAYPDNGVIQGTDGNFYGTTNGGGNYSNGTIFKLTPTGVLTTLHVFDGTDGENIDVGLVQNSDGTLYGASRIGGVNGAGTVFMITPAGHFTTLYKFCSRANCVDGANPYALILSSDGDLYRATLAGGSSKNFANCACGTIFKLSPSGKLSTIYTFCAQSGCADGSGPNSLIQAKDGDFYGTTKSGGANYSGTFFKLTRSGALTTLHSFNEIDPSR